MPVSSDIVATYKGPGRVMRRQLDMGENEGRALAILMGSCVLVFISQLPSLARKAHLDGVELNGLLGASLFSWLFIAPLLLYVVALISHGIARLFGGRGTGFGARMALFWSFLAASPLLLLHGLVAGFVGAGPQMTLVGVVWWVVLVLFWALSLKEAEWGRK
ncbi:YIP1 family protein [Roseovarius sp. LXJ103]|uniref:YIP1 family protein n=1 Tax=Roseovarius carneus TaxID=2853164 RepID=UPI000D619177|nr:YIP1 family protein [Roseovarius carneus]MBZ8119208.1 YIP1 family protein [Roseovarius carneus]PWE35166.1 YIP1 family protein [Pelagicola sp. LXJ1103]